jgi:hypothetical protein
MLGVSNVAQLCGLHDKVNYINTIMRILRTDTPQAAQIREAVRRSLLAE